MLVQANAEILDARAVLIVVRPRERRPALHKEPNVIKKSSTCNILVVLLLFVGPRGEIDDRERIARRDDGANNVVQMIMIAVLNEK